MYGYGFRPNNKMFGGGGGAIDADALNFISTASITDLTQQSAINQLVLDLKSYSIWSKLHALYPIVGGNSLAHSYNLIDTSNYQITFNGGWTHSLNGALPNGTNGYADTGFNPLLNYDSIDSYGLGFYSRTNNFSSTKSDFGSNSAGLYSYTRYDASSGYINVFNGEKTVSVSDSRGLFSFVNDGVNRIMKRNQSTLISTTGGAITFPNSNILFSCRTSTTVFGNREMALLFISKSMSSTDIDNLYTAVQTYQTALSRQV